ncbi:MAG TPA: hypothetical protein VLW50_02050 [Streptosporangiaceae bacterium]|nr:hypothetical protein [Streptosporangiaceae bacterium]
MRAAIQAAIGKALLVLEEPIVELSATTTVLSATPVVVLGSWAASSRRQRSPGHHALSPEPQIGAHLNRASLDAVAAVSTASANTAGATVIATADAVVTAADATVLAIVVGAVTKIVSAA